MPIYTYALLYFLVIVFALINYNKFSHNTELRYFFIFLVYSFFTELIGAYFGYILKIKTYPIYNTWIIASSLFYCLFFLKGIKKTSNRNYVKGIILIYSLITIIDIVFITDYLEKGLTYNTIIGKIFVVILIMVYFSELLLNDAILNVKNSLFFWIGIGVLIFNIGFIPVFVIVEYISYGSFFKNITLGLNIITDLCFITGFIVSKKEFNN